MKKRIYLPKLVPLCPLMRSQALSPQLVPKSVIANTAIGDVTSRTPHLNFQVPQSLFGGSFFLAPYAVSSSVFAAMVTVFFYLHIFTGSVGKRILIVVPVDTLYRTSIISSSTVVLLNPFANLSLAPLSLFSIYGPDVGVWPDCWVSAEFLRAPIPRKGSGSTTTTVINRCQFISECESSSLKIMPIYFVTRLVDFLTETSASFIPFQITLFLFVAIIN